MVEATSSFGNEEVRFCKNRLSKHQVLLGLDLKFKNKKAAAFGCYGWSGEAVKIISEKLTETGFQLLNAGIREKWNPSAESVDNCIRFGTDFALSLNNTP